MTRLGLIEVMQPELGLGLGIRDDDFKVLYRTHAVMTRKLGFDNLEQTMIQMVNITKL